MNKLGKTTVIVFIIFIVLAIAYAAFPKSFITMSVAPSSMSLSIDGGGNQTVTTGQSVWVIAGTHKYTFSRDGFASTTVTLTSGNNETKEILLALDPQTDAARSILENDTDASHAIQERVESQKEAAATAALNASYPILKDLPIVLHSIEIDSCPSVKYPGDATKMALCVYSTDPANAPSFTADVLQQKGYDASKYEIIYEPASN